MTVEQVWSESQGTWWTLENGRTLSSMTYVGIRIHPMTGKPEAWKMAWCFLLHKYLDMLIDPKYYWYCVIKNYSIAHDTGRNCKYRDHE